MSNLKKITLDQLLTGYAQGFFPMAHQELNNDIFWHLPEKRGIIPLDEFVIPKNLRRLYEKRSFQLEINKNFKSVIQNCADRKETWISPEIMDAFLDLHKKGFAYSFEAYQENKLVGGLYGVALRRVFFGESMFFKVSNASKVTLIFLVEFLIKNGYKLLDTQYLNPHLKQFGAIEIENDAFQKLLFDALAD
ncbi:MAG: Leucyl/phenylalanyl-tRNA--protein transferase [Bacteroidetes bacterium MED-G17]|nr:MAG: Leucyl/phenylalanyl-tRNA--protein transferase [Bacteroidetes bacterium MED-G17]